jgi:hypothetical protein
MGGLVGVNNAREGDACNDVTRKGKEEKQIRNDEEMRQEKQTAKPTND